MASASRLLAGRYGPMVLVWGRQVHVASPPRRNNGTIIDNRQLGVPNTL